MDEIGFFGVSAAEFIDQLNGINSDAVDVYINNTKTFSQDIEPGPFSLKNSCPFVSIRG